MNCWKLTEVKTQNIKEHILRASECSVFWIERAYGQTSSRHALPPSIIASTLKSFDDSWTTAE